VGGDRSGREGRKERALRGICVAMRFRARRLETPRRSRSGELLISDWRFPSVDCGPFVAVRGCLSSRLRAFACPGLLVASVGKVSGHLSAPIFLSTSGTSCSREAAKLAKGAERYTPHFALWRSTQPPAGRRRRRNGRNFSPPSRTRPRGERFDCRVPIADPLLPGVRWLPSRLRAFA
jgi:hypothetical protein